MDNFVSKKPMVSIKYIDDVKFYQDMGLLTYECIDDILHKPRPIGYVWITNAGRKVNIRNLSREDVVATIDFLMKEVEVANKSLMTDYYDWITILQDELTYRDNQQT